MSKSGQRTPPIRKRYGQNFLTDRNIIDKIIETLQPRRSDHMLEIGPGRGALTEHLIGQCDCLEAIEIDRDLVQLLTSRFAGAGLKIHQADVLSFDFNELEGTRPIRIVGNLPYNISTPLIFRLLETGEAIHDMVLMLQREVVDRMVAPPGSPAYGRLGIMAGYYCKIERCFQVPPTAFHPQPKVHSTVARLTPYREPPVPAVDPAQLKRVVTQAFSQRRKVLRNSLKGLLEEGEITDLGIDSRARCETLTIEEFVLLADYLVRKQGEGNKGKDRE